jgi:hypothetical protein
MSLVTQEAGRVAVQTAGATTPVSINASTTITLPTATQRPKPSVGILECVVSLEGGTARWTTNGVTPTAAVGMLMQPNTYLTLHGENSISNFRIIGTAAGFVITTQFFIADLH